MRRCVAGAGKGTCGPRGGCLGRVVQKTLLRPSDEDGTSLIDGVHAEGGRVDEEVDWGILRTEGLLWVRLRCCRGNLG
jgi:hypothetical protein